MRFSVVINTVNRAQSLRRTLNSLRWQTHDSFEVIVVNGPSSDDTDEVLKDFADRIRVDTCSEMNLSKSRNVGIAAAAGEIVAFIDDDAIPEPDWLRQLDAAYDDARICGVGGIVYDHTGCTLQYRYSTSDRVGRTRFDVRPPFGLYNIVGADPFVYLQGTNMSFRRECLGEIGGFDEEIEYNFDEVEVCLSLIDRGYRIRPLDGAAVHHKYLASHVRNAKRLFTDPFFAIKNRAYFALRNGQDTRSTADILSSLMEYVEEVKNAARCQHGEGLLTAGERDFFLRQVDRGIDAGVERGLKAERQSIEIPGSKEDQFFRFQTLPSPAEPLRICFISQEYPPGDFGGIGRFTADLASGFAKTGHEVHVITRSTTHATVDFEDGVWMHRVAVTDHGLGELTQTPLRGNLDHIASVYQEVASLHERRPLDLVSAPLWAAEGLICLLDDRFPTVTTLMTTMHTIANLHKSWSGLPQIEASLRLEKATVEESGHLHAISDAILEEIRETFDTGRADASVIPLGVQDIRESLACGGRELDESVEVLFVGRLEFRKGVDVLLEAIVDLAREFPRAHFTLAGKDTINTEIGESFRGAFVRRTLQTPELAQRVTFTGAVSDDELERLYSTADVFCSPSRYESFGLVLVEAMRYGIPVVGCDVGGMPEIVEDGRNGFLAKPGDVKSLAECLSVLIDDVERRIAYGQRSREIYEERFTLDAAVARTVAAYTEIAQKHRTAGSDPPSSKVRSVSMIKRLGETLISVAEVDPVTARRAAARLLVLRPRESDPLGELETVWQLSDDEFIIAAYRVILNREPDAPGVVLAREALSKGTSRLIFVWGLARSELGIALGLDTSWLPRLTRLAGDDDIARLRSVWGLPDRDFMDCVYEIVLQRPSDDGCAVWLERMRNGASRVDIVQGLLASDEAQARGFDLDERWRQVLETVPIADKRSRSLPRRVRMRRAVARLPVIGDVGRTILGLRRGSDELKDLPGSLTELKEATRRHEQTLVGVGNAVEQQMLVTRSEVSSIDARIDRLDEELVRVTDRLMVTTEASREQFALSQDQMTAKINVVLEAAMRQLGDRISHQGYLIEQSAQRIDILQRKLEALSLDLREQVLAPNEDDRGVTAHVVSEKTYKKKIEEMDGDIRVNIGCGEKPLAEYLNIDFRELPDVDIVADARKLPFADETLGEIASAHLVEHFRQHQLATVILPYWRRLLKPKGRLRVICPNWAAMLERVYSNDMNLKEFKTVTFGLQDYSGDEHFSMYTPESLTELLTDAGFGDIKVLAHARQNGICPEMEILAVRA